MGSGIDSDSDQKWIQVRIREILDSDQEWYHNLIKVQSELDKGLAEIWIRD